MPEQSDTDSSEGIQLPRSHRRKNLLLDSEESSDDERMGQTETNPEDNENDSLEYDGEANVKNVHEAGKQVVKKNHRWTQEQLARLLALFTQNPNRTQAQLRKMKRTEPCLQSAPLKNISDYFKNQRYKPRRPRRGIIRDARLLYTDATTWRKVFSKSHIPALRTGLGYLNKKNSHPERFLKYIFLPTFAEKVPRNPRLVTWNDDSRSDLLKYLRWHRRNRYCRKGVNLFSVVFEDKVGYHLTAEVEKMATNPRGLNEKDRKLIFMYSRKGKLENVDRKKGMRALWTDIVNEFLGGQDPFSIPANDQGIRRLAQWAGIEDVQPANEAPEFTWCHMENPKKSHRQIIRSCSKSMEAEELNDVAKKILFISSGLFDSLPQEMKQELRSNRAVIFHLLDDEIIKQYGDGVVDIHALGARIAEIKQTLSEAQVQDYVERLDCAVAPPDDVDIQSVHGSHDEDSQAEDGSYDEESDYVTDVDDDIPSVRNKKRKARSTSPEPPSTSSEAQSSDITDQDFEDVVINTLPEDLRIIPISGENLDCGPRCFSVNATGSDQDHFTYRQLGAQFVAENHEHLGSSFDKLRAQCPTMALSGCMATDHFMLAMAMSLGLQLVIYMPLGNDTFLRRTAIRQPIPVDQIHVLFTGPSDFGHWSLLAPVSTPRPTKKIRRTNDAVGFGNHTHNEDLIDEELQSGATPTEDNSDEGPATHHDHEDPMVEESIVGEPTGTSDEGIPPPEGYSNIEDHPLVSEFSPLSGDQNGGYCGDVHEKRETFTLTDNQAHTLFEEKMNPRLKQLFGARHEILKAIQSKDELQRIADRLYQSKDWCALERSCNAPILEEWRDAIDFQLSCLANKDQTLEGETQQMDDDPLCPVITKPSVDDTTDHMMGEHGSGAPATTSLLYEMTESVVSSDGESEDDEDDLPALLEVSSLPECYSVWGEMEERNQKTFFIFLKVNTFMRQQFDKQKVLSLTTDEILNSALLEIRRMVPNAKYSRKEFYVARMAVRVCNAILFEIKELRDSEWKSEWTDPNIDPTLFQWTFVIYGLHNRIVPNFSRAGAGKTSGVILLALILDMKYRSVGKRPLTIVFAMGGTLHMQWINAVRDQLGPNAAVEYEKGDNVDLVRGKILVVSIHALQQKKWRGPLQQTLCRLVRAHNVTQIQFDEIHNLKNGTSARMEGLKPIIEAALRYNPRLTLTMSSATPTLNGYKAAMKEMECIYNLVGLKVDTKLPEQWYSRLINTPMLRWCPTFGRVTGYRIDTKAAHDEPVRLYHQVEAGDEQSAEDRLWRHDSSQHTDFAEHEYVVDCDFDQIRNYVIASDIRAHSVDPRGEGGGKEKGKAPPEEKKGVGFGARMKPFFGHQVAQAVSILSEWFGEYERNGRPFAEIPRVLVYCDWHSDPNLHGLFVERCRSLLPSWVNVLFYGGSSRCTRKEIEERCKAPHSDPTAAHVLYGTPALKEGSNFMIQFNKIIYLSIPPTWGAEQQIEGRLDRTGQKRSVEQVMLLPVVRVTDKQGRIGYLRVGLIMLSQIYRKKIMSDLMLDGVDGRQHQPNSWINFNIGRITAAFFYAVDMSLKYYNNNRNDGFPLTPFQLTQQTTLGLSLAKEHSGSLVLDVTQNIPLMARLRSLHERLTWRNTLMSLPGSVSLIFCDLRQSRICGRGDTLSSEGKAEIVCQMESYLPLLCERGCVLMVLQKPLAHVVDEVAAHLVVKVKGIQVHNSHLKENIIILQKSTIQASVGSSTVPKDAMFVGEPQSGLLVIMRAHYHYTEEVKEEEAVLDELFELVRDALEELDVSQLASVIAEQMFPPEYVDMWDESRGTWTTRERGFRPSDTDLVRTTSTALDLSPVNEMSELTKAVLDKLHLDHHIELRAEVENYAAAHNAALIVTGRCMRITSLLWRADQGALCMMKLLAEELEYNLLVESLSGKVLFIRSSTPSFRIIFLAEDPARLYRCCEFSARKMSGVRRVLDFQVAKERKLIRRLWVEKGLNKELYPKEWRALM